MASPPRRGAARALLLVLLATGPAAGAAAQGLDGDPAAGNAPAGDAAAEDELEGLGAFAFLLAAPAFLAVAWVARRHVRRAALPRLDVAHGFCPACGDLAGEGPACRRCGTAARAAQRIRCARCKEPMAPGAAACAACGLERAAVLRASLAPAPPEVLRLARRFDAAALVLAGATFLATAAEAYLVASLASVGAVLVGLRGFGLRHGAAWAWPAVPAGLAARPEVQAHFHRGRLCPVCAVPALPGARYCVACGDHLAAGEPSFGALARLAFARLVRPQPVEPPRAQAFLLRPQEGTSHRHLLLAVGLMALGMFLTTLTGFLEQVGVTLATFVPAFVLLAWLRHQDRFDVEPWGLVLVAFGWGVLAGFFVIPLNTLVGWPPIAGLTEELAKGLFVFVLAAHSALRSEFNGPVDGLIYGAAAGLGFAAMENFAYVTGLFLPELGPDGLVPGLLIRSTGLLAHALWAGLTGSFVGLMLLRHGRVSPRMFLAGALPAIVLHAASNGHLDLVGPLVLLTLPLELAVAAWMFFKLLEEGQRDEAAWGLAAAPAAREGAPPAPGRAPSPGDTAAGLPGDDASSHRPEDAPQS